MLQCDGPCGRLIDPDRVQERGPQVKGIRTQLEVGYRRTVRDRYDNEIIAEIRCQDCEDERVRGLPDQEGPGAGAA